MSNYLFKTPLSDEDVRKFVRSNKEKLVDDVSSGRTSIAQQQAEINGLIENLTNDEKSRFWRILRKEIKGEDTSHPPYPSASHKERISEKTLTWIIVGVVLAVILLIGKSCSDSMNSPEAKARGAERDKQVQAEIVLRQHLKDGSSAELKNKKGYCGEVNAKNSFGAYNGFKRYIVVSGKSPIIEGETGITGSQFQGFWTTNCH